MMALLTSAAHRQWPRRPIVSLERRHLVVVAMTGWLACARPVAAAALPDDLAAAVAAFAGGMPVREGRVSLEIAELVDNGNTVPVRVTIDEHEPIGSWLRALQTRQAESEPFQYGALAEIQRWSGAGAGAPLFDTLLNVANYNVSTSLQAPGPEFAVREVRAWEPNNYPLTLVVPPGPSGMLLTGCNTSRGVSSY